MRSVGLITEYNPFHNGHLHHLQESLAVTQSDVAVAVMSGHFLQRGEAALLDKWRRTEMALAAGVDIVVELPVPWACSSAPDFACGAVQALTALGVDSLCFGSEAGEIAPLQRCSETLTERDDILEKETAQLLRHGVSYPLARQQAVEQFLAEEDAALLVTPNNILGIEYLNAIRRSGSPVRPTTIKRVGAGYHDTHPGRNGIASATGIRNRLASGKDVEPFLPAAVFPSLRAAQSERALLFLPHYFRLLLGQIFSHSNTLTRYALVENGIENRLLDVAERAASMDELITGLKSRQLTRTRIQRLLVAIVLALDKGVVNSLFESGPLYLHLLGASSTGRRFLAAGRKSWTLPLIQNFSRVYPQLKRSYGATSEQYQLAMEQLELELRATKIYTLIMEEYRNSNRNRDFFEKLRG